eukprot:COSAG06_NODE_5567_length_3397_cov_3.112492_4_plen_142_part_00
MAGEPPAAALTLGVEVVRGELEGLGAGEEGGDAHSDVLGHCGVCVCVVGGCSWRHVRRQESRRAPSDESARGAVSGGQRAARWRLPRVFCWSARSSVYATEMRVLGGAAGVLVRRRGAGRHVERTERGGAAGGRRSGSLRR